MTAFHPARHSHIVLMLPRTRHSHLLYAAVVPSTLRPSFITALLKLDLGETVNIDDNCYYVISPHSLAGRKIGKAAIIRRTIKDTKVTTDVEAELRHMVARLVELHEHNEADALRLASTTTLTKS